MILIGVRMVNHIFSLLLETPCGSVGSDCGSVVEFSSGGWEGGWRPGFDPRRVLIFHSPIWCVPICQCIYHKIKLCQNVPVPSSWLYFLSEVVSLKLQLSKKVELYSWSCFPTKCIKKKTEENCLKNKLNNHMTTLSHFVNTDWSLNFIHNSAFKQYELICDNLIFTKLFTKICHMATFDHLSTLIGRWIVQQTGND